MARVGWPDSTWSRTRRSRWDACLVTIRTYCNASGSMTRRLVNLMATIWEHTPRVAWLHQWAAGRGHRTHRAATPWRSSPSARARRRTCDETPRSLAELVGPDRVRQSTSVRSAGDAAAVEDRREVKTPYPHRRGAARWAQSSEDDVREHARADTLQADASRDRIVIRQIRPSGWVCMFVQGVATIVCVIH